MYVRLCNTYPIYLCLHLSYSADVIDMVNDQLSGSDYKKEEDPRHYVSEKTGRGQLPDDWISNPPDGVIMCSYKLIKVRMIGYMYVQTSWSSGNIDELSGR